MLCDRCKVELKTIDVPKLTDNAKHIYDYCADYFETRRNFPSLFEIAYHFKYKSESTVYWHLVNLEKAGYIYRVGCKRFINEFCLNKDNQ